MIHFSNLTNIYFLLILHGTANILGEGFWYGNVLYILVFLFSAGLGSFLCNVGAAFAATGYYQKINWSKINIAEKKSDVVQTTMH